MECNINELEHCGLDRCPDRGYNHFKRYVGLAVCAYNLRKIGAELLALQRAKEKYIWVRQHNNYLILRCLNHVKGNLCPVGTIMPKMAELLDLNRQWAASGLRLLFSEGDEMVMVQYVHRGKDEDHILLVSENKHHADQEVHIKAE